MKVRPPVQVQLNAPLEAIAQGETFIYNAFAYMKIGPGGIPGAAVPAGSFAVVELTSGQTTTLAGSAVVQKVDLVAST